MQDETLPFLTRLWFAIVCWSKVLFDASFARRAWALAHEGAAPATLPGPVDRGQLATADRPAPEGGNGNGRARTAPPAEGRGPTAKSLVVPPAPPNGPALQLLSLLQREGRLIDFLEEDVAGFSDADVGAAARAVHEGCRRALREHVALEPVRGEEEGKRVALGHAPSPDEIKLVGNVQGTGPFEGVLRHRGWRVRELHLPVTVGQADAHVIAPAEVEL